jgi:hypothetical protein
VDLPALTCTITLADFEIVFIRQMVIYFLYLKIPIRHHHRHNFVTDIDPRLTRVLPICDVRSTLLTLITIRQTELATLRCVEFFYAPTGQKAHSTGQRPVKNRSNNSRPERAKAKRGRKKLRFTNTPEPHFHLFFQTKQPLANGACPRYTTQVTDYVFLR